MDSIMLVNLENEMKQARHQYIERSHALQKSRDHAFEETNVNEKGLKGLRSSLRGMIKSSANRVEEYRSIYIDILGQQAARTHVFGTDVMGSVFAPPKKIALEDRVLELIRDVVVAMESYIAEAKQLREDLTGKIHNLENEDV